MSHSKAGAPEELALLRDLVGSGPVVMFVADWPSGTTTYVSDNVREVLGCSPEEIVGIPNFWPARIHPEDVGGVRSDLERAMGCRKTRSASNYRFLHKDGDYRWMHEVRVLNYDEQGKLLTVRGYSTDVTNLRATLEAFRENEIRFRSVADGTADGIVAADQHGNLTYMNRSALTMFGRQSEDVLGKPLSVLIPHPLGKVQGIGQILELTALRADGTEFPVEMSIAEWPGATRTHLIGIVRDISERKRVEAELVARSSRLAAVTDLGRMALVGVPLPTLFDQAVRITARELDTPFAAVLEYHAPGENGVLRAAAGWDPLLLERECPMDATPAEHTILTGEPVVVEDFAADKRFPPPPLPTAFGIASALTVAIRGKEHPFGILAAHDTRPRPFSEDEVLFLRSVANVLSEAIDRSRADDALREARLHLEYLLSAGPVVVSESRLSDGRVTYVSPNSEAAFGFTPQEVLDDPGWLVGFIHPDDQPAVFDAMAQAFAKRASRRDFRYRCRRKDGTYRWTFTATRFRYDEQGSPINSLSYSFDIDDRVRARQERKAFKRRIEQFQRLESLGRLAGGVAHDFNNLLSVILNYTNFALSEAGDREAVRENLVVVTDAAERAAALTRQLMIFGRGELEAGEIIDLNEVTADAEALLPFAVGEQIKLDVVLGPHLPPVKLDRSRAEQVLINLAVNGRDAMPSGGRLTISTKAVDLGAEATAHSAEPGRYVCLSVSDTGTGMAPEVADRAFEPFFTTKPSGLGTGLGLATVYAIASQAGGFATIVSSEGSGTRIDVHLPATDAPAGNLEQIPEPGNAEGLGETILVAEDEDAVRKAACRILSRGGYRTLEAGSGEDALRVSQEQGVQLLLTDIVMPAMSGKDLATKLRRRYPGLRVLYMSGYPGEAVSRGRRKLAPSEMLEKPFTEDSLLKRVRAALDAPLRD